MIVLLEVSNTLNLSGHHRHHRPLPLERGENSGMITVFHQPSKHPQHMLQAHIRRGDSRGDHTINGSMLLLPGQMAMDPTTAEKNVLEDRQD